MSAYWLLGYQNFLLFVYKYDSTSECLWGTVSHSAPSQLLSCLAPPLGPTIAPVSLLLRAWRALVNDGRGASRAFSLSGCWSFLTAKALIIILLPYLPQPHTPCGNHQEQNRDWKKPRYSTGTKSGRQCLFPGSMVTPTYCRGCFHPLTLPSIRLLSIFLLFSSPLSSPLPSPPLLSPLSSVGLRLGSQHSGD